MLKRITLLRRGLIFVPAITLKQITGTMKVFKITTVNLSLDNSEVLIYGKAPFVVVYKKYNQILKYLTHEDVQFLLKTKKAIKKASQKNILKILNP